MKGRITADELRKEFFYNPETGEFWRLNQRSGSGHRHDMTKPCGSYNSQGYRRMMINKKSHTIHRLAWLYVHGCWPELNIDHINGDRSDNRICNLREATHDENLWNSTISTKNTSGFKGVHWHKRLRTWEARISALGKRRDLGRFKCPVAAHFAYCVASDKLHGEFARVK